MSTQTVSRAKHTADLHSPNPKNDVIIGHVEEAEAEEEEEPEELKDDAI